MLFLSFSSDGNIVQICMCILAVVLIDDIVSNTVEAWHWVLQTKWQSYKLKEFAIYFKCSKYRIVC